MRNIHKDIRSKLSVVSGKPSPLNKEAGQIMTVPYLQLIVRSTMESLFKV